jgi:glycosyltransferase involved in cell wall biosynthesis
MKEKPKLAYISPLPPEASGISFYSNELLPYLAKYYQIDLVVNQEALEVENLRDFRVINVDEFLRKVHSFDRVLYQFGNSFFHKHMIPLLEEVPGVVVMHDIYLADFMRWLQETQYYSKDILYEELYYSHGFTGLIKLKMGGIEEIKMYPLNRSILNNSIGIIVHSKHSLNLLESFYSLDTKRCAVIPRLKKVCPYEQKNRNNDEILVCSFGYSAPVKLSHLIVEAFALSEIGKIDQSSLVFVGESSPPEYKGEIYKIAEKYGIKKKVRVLGFVSEKEYEDYLHRCSIAIQLRKMSKGEVSRAVLDTLAHGIVTIVNKEGSMDEFPDDVVFKIERDVNPEILAHAMNIIYRNPELMAGYSHKAKKYIEEIHAPERIASMHFDIIEKFYKINRTVPLMRNLKNLVDHKSIFAVSNLISLNLKNVAEMKNIFVDISQLSKSDYKTGIQRVVKAQLKGLIDNPPPGYRIETVGITMEGEGVRFRYFREFLLNFLKIEKKFLGDADVVFKEGDIYYAPDLTHEEVREAYKAGIYQKLLLKGVKIIFFVHDLLPLEFPYYFPPHFKKLHEEWVNIVTRISTKLICNSHATAQSVRKFAEKYNLNKDLKIAVLPPGSDFFKAKHIEGINKKELEIFKRINSKPYFLMVSTIEPRKGHFQVLKAFENLWNEGYDFHLVYAGKEGWMVEDLIRYMNDHPEKGRKFFWLGYVSDDFLEHLYRNAMACIVASEGEGFGLSIIEAAHFGTPIIARDIPVFREVGREGVFYFRNTREPKILTEDIKKWLVLYKEGEFPKPDVIKPMTWEEHVTQLKEILVNE